MATPYAQRARSHRELYFLQPYYFALNCTKQHFLLRAHPHRASVSARSRPKRSQPCALTHASAAQWVRQPAIAKEKEVVFSTPQYLNQPLPWHLSTASISYDALSTASKVSVQRLKAIIRMSMTTGLFREDVDGGSVVHSATSAFLVRDPVVYSYAIHMCGGSVLVAQKMAAAALKWGPDSTQLYETAFNVALDTDLPFFDHLSRNPDKMAEFSAYMRNVRSSDTVSLRHLTAGFAWEGIREDGVVVDVGGSTGDAAIAIAEAFPHLKLVGKNLPVNADNGRKMLDSSPDKASLAARITFQGHDFMKKQPVRGADVYLLRTVLHDWTDAQAAKIVHNLVDAMKDRPSSKLYIMDTVLPKPGSVPVSIKRLVRARYMTMLQTFTLRNGIYMIGRHCLRMLMPDCTWSMWSSHLVALCRS